MSATSSSPWREALSNNFEALCRHICATIEVSDGVEVVGAMPHIPLGSATPEHIKIILKKNRKKFSYNIRLQNAETGEPSLQASTALAQLIMDDPLLLNGVSDFECSPSTSYIVFHGHKVDISNHFDGKELQTSAVVTEIIRNISATTTAKHICSIGMVPIKGNIAFLECEDSENGHRFYEEANIRKWVEEHGTSPFTRAAVTLSDIKMLAAASVPMCEQPALPNKRKTVVTNKKPSKKIRTVSNKHICAVWDRSGSMRSMGDAPLDGLKKVISDQQSIAASSGNPTYFTLHTFDSHMEVPVDNQDISTVDFKDEWIQPRGCTRLYDTIVDAACSLQKRMKEGESGVFIVMTDGDDNSSESSSTIVKETMDSLQSKNDVECIFMAANIGNAQQVGQTMGFNEDTSMTFTPEASQAAFECMSQSALRSVTGGSAAFTRMERQSSVAPIQPFRARTMF